MVVRAAMQGAGQSPAPRGSLAATARRLLVAGLTATIIATSRPAVGVAAGQSDAAARLGRGALLTDAEGHGRGPVAPALPLHDVGGPDMSGEPGAQPGPGPDSEYPPANPGKSAGPDVQQQGNVVAVFDDPVDPLIVIAVDHGYLTVRLRCGDRCPTIHRGDYVVAEGLGRSEAVFDADDIWVVGP